MTEHRASSIVCRRNVASDVTRMPLMSLDTFQKFNVLALMLDTLRCSAVHYLTASPAPSGAHNDGADDASRRRK
jgi:hypothetical protein